MYTYYSIKVKDRDAILKKLNEKEIPTQIHYHLPLHMNKAYKKLCYKEGDFPASEEVSSQIISLPMSASITEDQQDYIVEAFKGE